MEEVLHEEITFERQRHHCHIEAGGSGQQGIRPVPVARQSDATFYKWRTKFSDMDISMMSRMKELEERNRRLKKMYAEERLKAEIVQEVLQKSG